MLAPKRIKYRKQQTGRMRGLARRGCKLNFGEFGLKAIECGRMTSRVIEAARVAISRRAKRGGRLWIRVFPDKPYTSKPAETRMGSGKGSPEGWVAIIKPGKILYEIGGIPEDMAREALRVASHKLPFATRIVSRQDEI